MHKKLLILVILIFFSCNLSKSEQNNQISALDTDKIKEYQKNESQTNIQLSNEIKAFKIIRKTTVTTQNSNTTTNRDDLPHSATILKIEKQNNGNIIITEANTKIAEIQKDKIYRFKEAIEYGGIFIVKDIRTNQNSQDFNDSILVSSHRNYVHFSPPVITTTTDSNTRIYTYETYIMKEDDLLRIANSL
ncbi:hypothetical protein [Borreliella bavariensis]|uniref:hypothetical protein n=1 Tax=Borreliella bavariensis TaxID=664662 RepID=UPI001C000DA9|nr:hypothetical protein [Borreliella bavariensis]